MKIFLIKMMGFSRGILSPIKLVALLLFCIEPSDCVAAESFSKFGIIRANIADYVSGHRWLAYYQPQRLIKKGDVVEIFKSEVVGFDAEGNFFRIQGDVRPGAVDLLSLESYVKPSVTFSTKEGYCYVWNPQNGEKPFETFMTMEDYDNLIQKFEFYPLLKSSKDGPIKFQLINENPEFYDQALALPRPNSTFHLESPKARRSKVGMYLAEISKHQCLVSRVLDNSAAAAAGIKADDVIVNVAINGKNVEMEKCFPLPSASSVK